ncbi:MAG: 3-methyl-2-oxobutanoate hydroxymethyltransferase [Phycisphaerales bacterium]|nr:3-methyl-2-oxobutanoate hydroxymethyltransferase [Phycisphaerales bacterium]
MSKITLDDLRSRKRAGKKFSVLTCYDFATARVMDQAGVEVLLVGDSAGEVVLGLPNTRGTPPNVLLHLTAAVRRGAPNAFLLGDFPFECMQMNDNARIDWARHFMQDAGCDALKVEVTGQDADLVSALRDADVPVVAHLGLLPQHIDPVTGYRARGKTVEQARELLEDAQILEKAGAVMLLLEAVAGEAARAISSRTSLPVIGCVAGPHCDGTVVVLHDMIGWGGGHPPRRVKVYANLADVMRSAFTAYVEDIHTGRFPTDAEAIHMNPGEYEKLVSAD